MGPRRLSAILITVGVCVLLSTWGHISDWTEYVLEGDEKVRHKKIVYWSASGSPEVDLKRAKQFEEAYPDVSVSPNFRESGRLQDMLFVSFLSGNPPDYMGAGENELRNYILMGGIRPIDDLIAAEDARLRKEGKGGYLDQFLIGKAKLYRFNVNPRDRFLRDREGVFEHPLEAARLLAMNGKVVGFRGVSMPSTLTYNKRLFREAAVMFPDKGLVDENGEPVPPTTWLELHEKAKVLTEYGKRAAVNQGKKDPVCYGMVIQGQRQRDLMRGINPLASRAGSVAFNFKGDNGTVHQHLSDTGPKQEWGKRAIGFFDYAHPSNIGAFALFLRLKRDDLILPGADARHYEDVRTALASGKAAMVIDGWHAALIGAERVPWAAQDLGSAPLPIPYHDVDPASGWTEEKVREEKQKLHTLLELDKVGLEIPPGNKLPRTAGTGIQFFTSLCRFPEAAWEWNHFEMRNEELLKAGCRRGTIRMERVAMAHRGDREWFPYPYQDQVFDIIEHHCDMWPRRPLHGPVKPATEQEVYYKWFYQSDVRDVGTVLRNVRKEIQAYTAAANRDLARRIEDGEVDPEEWTFVDWDPRSAETFFQRQQDRGSSGRNVMAALGERREKLVEYAKQHPELALLNEKGEIREDIWQFRPPGSPAQIVWIPALMLLVVLAWLMVMAIRNIRSQQPTLQHLSEARRHGHAYLFVLPGMLALFGFAIYPSLYQFYLAVHKGDGLGTMQYVGWANFERILDFTSDDFDTVFWTKVLPQTALYMFLCTVGEIILSLFLASLLNMPMKSNRVYRVFYFIPLVTSTAVVSVILLGLLKGEDAGLNQFLSWIGCPVTDAEGKAVNWLGPDYDLYTVIVVGIWRGLPYNIILLLAALQSISPQLYEAAKVDGANAWQRFWHITLPELMPILIVIIFQAFVGAARVFDSVYVLTEGGVGHSSEVVPTYIYKWGFMKPEGREADLGYASALGIVYSVMLACLTVTNVVIIARRWKRKLETERQAMSMTRTA